MYTADVIVVGGGPAGLSAALTLASEGRSVILLEKNAQVGGQAATSSLIENVPPFADGFSGAHFAEQSCRQCAKFGVDIQCNTWVYGIVSDGPPSARKGFWVYTNAGTFYGRVVLLALGMHCKWLGVPGEMLPHIHHGMDISAIDEACGKHVVLVGGGNSVGQAALYYLGMGAQVTIIARRRLDETMSWYLIKRLAHRVTLVYGKVKEFVQQTDGTLGVLVTERNPVWAVDCVHILIGSVPATEWLSGLPVLDEAGFILTGDHYETSVPGVFAIGDVTHDAVRRVTCAIGDGNRVVPAIHAFLEARQDEAA